MNYHWQAVSQGPSGPLKVRIGNQRKDGKYLVTYCYQRTIRKLETQARVDEIRADDDYRIIH